VNPASHNLFLHARSLVTAADIAAFCPSDPGYHTYVMVFTEIWQTGRFPDNPADISETLCNNWWTRRIRPEQEPNFRRFRTFTNAVGLCFCLGGAGPSDFLPPNYFAASLLEDTFALEDRVLLELLGPSFDEFHRRLQSYDEWRGEHPLFLLAKIILAWKLGEDVQAIAARCTELIAEADRLKPEYPADFLWDCTSFNQLMPVWKSLVAQTFPANAKEESVALLREMLAG